MHSEHISTRFACTNIFSTPHDLYVQIFSLHQDLRGVHSTFTFVWHFFKLLLADSPTALWIWKFYTCVILWEYRCNTWIAELTSPSSLNPENQNHTKFNKECTYWVFIFVSITQWLLHLETIQALRAIFYRQHHHRHSRLMWYTCCTQNYPHVYYMCGTTDHVICRE